MISRQEIDHLVEIEGHHIEVEEDLARIIDKIIEGDCKTILGITTEEIVIEIKSTGIEVELETITETLTETVLEMTMCRMRQPCTLPRRKDRRSSSRSMSRSASRLGLDQAQG